MLIIGYDCGGIEMDLSKYVADIQDFPEEGVLFRDVTPLLKDKDAYKEAIDRFVAWANDLGVKTDIVAGPEARGFLLIRQLHYGKKESLPHSSHRKKAS